MANFCGYMILACVWTCSCLGNIQWSYATRLHPVDDQKQIGTSVLDEFSGVGTLFKCSSACTKESQCQSFFFNTATGNCRTNTVGFSSDPGWNVPNKTLYYEIVHPGCPRHQGYRYFRAGELCYKIHTEAWLHWPDAREICRGEGGDLVTLKTQIRFDFMADTLFAPAIYASSKEGIIIGASDHVTDGDWRWVDGSVMSTDSSYWPHNQPDGSIYQNYARLTYSRQLDDMSYEDIYACEIIL